MDAATTAGARAAPATLTEADFVKTMADMQAHYTAAPTPHALPFPLETRFAAFALGRIPITLPAQEDPAAPPRVIAQPTVAHIARPIMSSTQQDTLAFIERHRRAVTGALTSLTGSNDTAAFVAAMQALERREQAEQAANIANMYRGLIAAGQAHPTARPAILVISHHTGGFLQGLFGDCRTALHGVVTDVRQAGHAVEHAAGSVAQWAGHAAQSVGKFFSSIF